MDLSGLFLDNQLTSLPFNSRSQYSPDHMSTMKLRNAIVERQKKLGISEKLIPDIFVRSPVFLFSFSPAVNVCEIHQRQ
jgi:hypothetical protein